MGAPLTGRRLVAARAARAPAAAAGISYAPEPLDAFYSARSRTMTAFSVWLRSRPDPADVALEIDGTASALRQLAALART